MSAHIPPNGITSGGGNILIYYATAPIGTISLGCYTVAFEITPSTEEIDVGVMCNASLTDQGRTTYSAVLTLLWEPALYTLLEPHINHQGEFKYFTEPPDATRHITFNTKFVAQPWGRFEIGQRVEVELPLAVLSTPIWADTVSVAVRKVSILDLTVDQVETLEKELGKPVDAWDELPSRMALYRRVYAMATGDEDATVRAMTMRELTEAISLGNEDAETENPTPAESGG